MKMMSQLIQGRLYALLTTLLTTLFTIRVIVCILCVTVVFEISYTCTLIRLDSRKINPTAVSPDRIGDEDPAFQTAF